MKVIRLHRGFEERPVRKRGVGVVCGGLFDEEGILMKIAGEANRREVGCSRRAADIPDPCRDKAVNDTDTIPRMRGSRRERIDAKNTLWQILSKHPRSGQKRHLRLLLGSGNSVGGAFERRS
jgi:hypothetical protein